MTTKTLLTTSLCSALALCVAQQASAATVVDFSFDNTANDTGPAFQEFDNGAGTPVQDITDGTIANGGSSGSGFNTVSSVDLTGFSSFTVQIDVEAASLNQGLNGTFFGITSGPTAGDTGGSALYNNAGSVGNPAVGVQLGSGRGGGNIDLALDQVGGNGTFTEISAAPTQVSMDDGFTLWLTFSDNGAGDAGIAVTSSGLSTEIAYAGTLSGVTYASLADDIHGNVSSQGGSVDLANYAIYDGGPIPEPSSLALLGLGGLLIARRRRS